MANRPQWSVSEVEKTREEVLAAAQTQALSLTAQSRVRRRSRLSVGAAETLTKTREKVFSSSLALAPDSSNPTNFALQSITCVKNQDDKDTVTTITSNESIAQSDMSASETGGNHIHSTMQEEATLSSQSSFTLNKNPMPNVQSRGNEPIHAGYMPQKPLLPPVLSQRIPSNDNKNQFHFERNLVNDNGRNAFENRSQRKVSFSDDHDFQSNDDNRGKKPNSGRGKTQSNRSPRSNNPRKHRKSRRSSSSRLRKEDMCLSRNTRQFSFNEESKHDPLNLCDDADDTITSSTPPRRSPRYLLPTRMFDCYAFDFDCNSLIEEVVDGEDDDSEFSIEDDSNFQDKRIKKKGTNDHEQTTFVLPTSQKTSRSSRV